MGGGSVTARSWLRNAVDVALNGAIDGTDTSIVVDDATLLPDDTPFYIVIDPFNDTGREYIKVGTITKGTNTLSTLTRNLEGSQSQDHPDASVVRLSWQSQHLQDIWDEVDLLYANDDNYLLLDGSNSPVTGPVTFNGLLTLGANIAMGNNRVTGLAVPPTADAEASPKKYVDDQDSAHVADADPHPQYLEPSEADAVYLKLDASNDPITGALDITAPVTIFDNKLLIHDSDLNFFLDTKFQANIQLAGQNRISFQQSDGRIRFIGQTGTVLGHLYDDGTNDLRGSMLGVWVFEASAVALSSTGNTTLLTGLLPVGSVIPGGATEVPELMVVASGFMRQNNQPFTSMQARAEIAATARSYGYAVGATNAASARSSVPLDNSARVAAGAASVAVQVTGRSFGANGVADIEVYFHVYAAPLGGNV